MKIVGEDQFGFREQMERRNVIRASRTLGERSFQHDKYLHTMFHAVGFCKTLNSHCRETPLAGKNELLKANCNKVYKK